MLRVLTLSNQSTQRGDKGHQGTEEIRQRAFEDPEPGRRSPEFPCFFAFGSTVVLDGSQSCRRARSIPAEEWRRFIGVAINGTVTAMRCLPECENSL